MVGSIDGLGWINKRRAIANPGNGASIVADVRTYATIADLRTYLQTADATYYTDNLLDIMTVNDMVYAARIDQDGGSTPTGVI